LCETNGQYFFDYGTIGRVKRRFRLTRSTDFTRVRRTGKSYAHPLVVLIVKPSEMDQIRVGISASHAVGNAVNRNRAKRRIRACVDIILPDLKPGWDVVILARAPSREAPFEDLLTSLRQLFNKADLLEQSHV
jgi:ribonuclease P protein component